MNKFRVREVTEFIIEAESKIEALNRYYMEMLPNPVATELRIRREEVS